ncbi:MAG: SDR family oxidoreductase [Solirubrobacteraceae bacterium]
METTTDAVFLTGATGFIGMELLVRYLERTERRIYALVRGLSDRDAELRMERTLLGLFGPDHRYAGRVIAVRGDLTHSGMGIGGGTDQLTEQVSEIVHSAASTSFELDLQSARAINVDGTRRVLDFAERCHTRGGLRRLSHISTAYVAGDASGCFSEDDLDVKQGFQNTYERSKFEAESHVARTRSHLPITIFRPSIVVGERVSGWTPTFNVLYWPLRAFSRGNYPVLPARRDSPADVVPVDYVADAIFALSQTRETEGSTFHLSAGAHASRVGDVVELAAAFFKRSQPRIIDPSLYHRTMHPLLLRVAGDERFRRELARSEVYFPYLAMRASFDDRRCRVALRNTDVQTTPLPSYFNRLLRFAVAAQWGRRQISRARANGYMRPPPFTRVAQRSHSTSSLVPVE